MWLAVAGTMSRGSAVAGTGVSCGPWIGWRQNRTFIFYGPGARSKTVHSSWGSRPGVFPAGMTPAENVEKIETLQAASGRVQAKVSPTGALAATRLPSTAIQQELDHERYTKS